MTHGVRITTVLALLLWWALVVIVGHVVLTLS